MRKISYLPYWILLNFVIISIAACDSNRVFDEYHHFRDARWNRYELAEFSFSVQDTKNPHNFFLSLRNSTDYEYSNLYLFMKTYLPDSTYTVDTIECLLADSKGKWYGKGMGKTKESRILLRNDLVFPQAGRYVVKFEQAMRVEDLIGIEDIGVRVEKTNKKPGTKK